MDMKDYLNSPELQRIYEGRAGLARNVGHTDEQAKIWKQALTDFALDMRKRREAGIARETR